MSNDSELEDCVAEYALGLLESAEASAFGAAVAEDRALALALQSFERASTELAVLADDATSPAPALSTMSARLMADATSEKRFTPFLDEMMRLTEMSSAHAMRMLAKIDQNDDWDPPSIPCADIMHLDTESPRADGAEVGFVRLAPGATFPHHSHDGDEDYLVLQGACKDSNGTIYAAGDRVLNRQGSAHSFTTVGKRPFIFVVVSRGITL